MAMNRSENMRRIRSKDTVPELAVRRLLHGMGYRYRLHGKEVPGKPDLVFAARRKVIFIHGCFWHQHPGCREGRPPKSNSGYWTSKLERNRQRDLLALEKLALAGWDSLVLWECEIKDIVTVATKVTTFLGAPRYSRQTTVTRYNSPASISS